MEKRIDRFDKNMKFKHLNDNIVTNDLGLSIGTIGKSRKEKRDLSNPVVEKILISYPDLNRVYLLTGKGPMIDNNNSFAVEEDHPIINYNKGVPYFSTGSFNGGFEFVVPDDRINPDYLIDFEPFNKATCWCNLVGRSMENEINNGDMIALKYLPDFSFLVFDNIYAIITTNDLRTVKRLKRSANPDNYLLVPSNTDYEPQELPKKYIYIKYSRLLDQ